MATSTASQPTGVSQFMKMSVQGGTGTSKTTLLALLSIGISLEYHNSAPVLVRDTEPGWHFMEPVFKLHGVPLIIDRGRDFKGMCTAQERAIKEKCCIFAGDSITHSWEELMGQFKGKNGKVPFHKFSQIRELWNEKFVIPGINANMHTMMAGRLSFEYFYDENEEGERELIKGDSRLKAGGGESYEYEVNLSAEVTRTRRIIKGLFRRGGGGYEYPCIILKDRSRALNGKSAVFYIENIDQKGSYKPILNFFRPHIERLRTIGGATIPSGDSSEWVPGGDSEYFARKRRKDEALDEIKSHLGRVFTASTGKDAAFKSEILNEIFGKASWTGLESMTADELEYGLKVCKRIVSLSQVKEPAKREELISIVDQAKKEIHDEAVNPPPKLCACGGIDKFIRICPKCNGENPDYLHDEVTEDIPF